MNAVEVVVRANCTQGKFFTSGKNLRILVFSDVNLDLANVGAMKLTFMLDAELRLNPNKLFSFCRYS